MRVLYIANAASLGSPLGYCPNYIYIENTFKQLGHDIRTINECDFTASQIVNELRAEKYDLILTEEARLKGDHKGDSEGNTHILGYFKEVMDCAKAKKIPVVAWLTNIIWGI